MSARQRLRPRVVVGHDRGALHEPEARPPAERPRHDTGARIEQVTGEDHGPGRATGKDRAARMGGRQRPTDRRPRQDLGEVRRLAARQVDEIGLADGLRRGRVVGVGAIADEHRFDLRTEVAEVGDTHRRPALEDVLAIGERGGRQDRDARPAAAGRRQQSGVEIGHRGEEFTGADERHGSGHGGESMRH